MRIKDILVIQADEHKRQVTQMNEWIKWTPSSLFRRLVFVPGKIRKWWWAVPVRSFAYATWPLMQCCPMFRRTWVILWNQLWTSVFCATMATMTPWRAERKFRNLTDTRNTCKTNEIKWNKNWNRIMADMSHWNVWRTYWTPSTVPSFLPDGSSNWTPHQLPGANFVSPIYCRMPARLPMPDDTMTRSPIDIFDSANVNNVQMVSRRTYALGGTRFGTDCSVICRQNCAHFALDFPMWIVLAKWRIWCWHLLSHTVNRHRSTVPMSIETIWRKCLVSVRIGSIVCPKRIRHSCHSHRPIRCRPSRPVQNVFRRWMQSGPDDVRQPKRVDRLWICLCRRWVWRHDLDATNEIKESC